MTMAHGRTQNVGSTDKGGEGGARVCVCVCVCVCVQARKFGAQGIGLTRTEHMFFASEERIATVRRMIVAQVRTLLLLMHLVAQVCVSISPPDTHTKSAHV